MGFETHERLLQCSSPCSTCSSFRLSFATQGVFDLDMESYLGSRQLSMAGQDILFQLCEEEYTHTGLEYLSLCSSS